MQQSVRRSGAEVITVSLRRESAGDGGSRFGELVRELGVRVLPNTAGCHSAREAITTAHMARELFDTNWIKLEVIGDDDTLQPDPFGLVEAATTLVRDGFEVFPYTTTDLVVAARLVDAGCRILMPWGAPIGTGRGLVDPAALATLRARFPDLTLVVDAGLGKPSHAAHAMELGYDAVLLNTAVATADDPPVMAAAFAAAVAGGRLGWEAGLMLSRERAVPSTPVVGQPFRL
jgi:thiazole synthase